MNIDAGSSEVIARKLNEVSNQGEPDAHGKFSSLNSRDLDLIKDGSKSEVERSITFQEMKQGMSNEEQLDRSSS
jgi:hypothetical protein